MVEPGKKPTRSAAFATPRGSANGLVKSAVDRQHREAADKPCRRSVGLLLQKLAGNIDRHIGRDRGAAVEQNPRLDAGAAAELDQRRAGGINVAISAACVLQDLDLAAGRIIFRQRA